MSDRLTDGILEEWNEAADGEDAEFPEKSSGILFKAEKCEEETMNDIYFTALGGGQHVGGSCYYLKLGSSNIILDAGIRTTNGIVSAPELYPLMTSPFLQSMSQIDKIFISHAHMDHVGYLTELMQSAGNASVYMLSLIHILEMDDLLIRL